MYIPSVIQWSCFVMFSCDSTRVDVTYTFQWYFTSIETIIRVPQCQWHYNDIIMGAIASQITIFMIDYPTVYSDADHKKHQSSASLAFVRGIHRWPLNSPHKWPLTRKTFPFDDVIMIQYCQMTKMGKNHRTDQSATNFDINHTKQSTTKPCAYFCVIYCIAVIIRIYAIRHLKTIYQSDCRLSPQNIHSAIVRKMQMRWLNEDMHLLTLIYLQTDNICKFISEKRVPTIVPKI